MAKEAFIFEVSDSSYGKYVLLNSHKVPVVVAFMGVWSEHCMVLTDIFARLAQEFAEEFVFARVDIDENPELKTKYQIENVPTVIVFREGEPVRVEIGALHEEAARSLLRDFGVFREFNEMRERAREMIVTVINMLAPSHPELAQQCRRRLSSMLSR